MVFSRSRLFHPVQFGYGQDRLSLILECLSLPNAQGHDIHHVAVSTQSLKSEHVLRSGICIALHSAHQLVIAALGRHGSLVIDQGGLILAIDRDCTSWRPLLGSIIVSFFLSKVCFFEQHEWRMSKLLLFES